MRAEHPEAIYHAMARGNNRQAVFHRADDYDQFLRVLLSVKAKQPFKLYGYCLMTNHIHLLLQPETGSSLSAIMQRLLGIYATHHNQRYDCEGHVWKSRFYSRIITDDIYALRVLAYVDLNPVRARLCVAAHDYVWSSARAHLLKHRDPCLDPYPLLGQAERQQAYQDLLVECGSQRDATLEFRLGRGRPKNSSDEFPTTVSTGYPQIRQTNYSKEG